MPIRKLDELIEVVKSQGEKKRLIAAWADDSHTIGAIYNAMDNNLVDAVLVGDEGAIRKTCEENGFDVSRVTIVTAPSDVKAAEKAVAMINAGEGEILMKGLVSTDKYMRAILDKEKGLMPSPNAVLSHVTVIETPRYPKLIVCGDVAVIPLPDLKQKTAILNYLVTTAKALGIDRPKVAVLAASEQVLPKMEACVDAAILSKMGERGQIKGGAIIDGPLALDVAIDKESVEIKGITGEVAGDADCILFPNIESGNVFYKTNTKLAGAELGALVFGAKVPCILSSRGDSTKTKLYSIALGALMAK